MLSKILTIAIPLAPTVFAGQHAQPSSASSVDLSWHAPRQYGVNSLSSAINGTGTYGFIFNSSSTPAGVPPSTYNWCNMPHVTRASYPEPPAGYRLAYVEVIHRHHKRTPYASNTFPVEAYGWNCSDAALFYYGAPTPGSHGNASAATFWRVGASDVNPFKPAGFPGSCDFPQITREGLDDSWQHGRDLYQVYHDRMGLIPKDASTDEVSFRVSNNVITSQVAGMVVNGMFGEQKPYLLNVQPPSIDSLEPTYSCPAASSLFSSYGVGSSNPNWTAHLDASRSLFNRLDALSGVSPSDNGWHQSWDHYFDNLSARLCHQKPLPCNIDHPDLCVTQTQADEVFRLGEYEYSYIYRDAPQSLAASVGSYGVWVAELSEHLRQASTAPNSKPKTVYRHNVAHDGSVSRLLSILQLDEMVWPGMGSEVVFELHQHEKGWFVRILWSGQVLQSSSPVIGKADMVPLDRLLAYFDGLTGRKASLIPGKCSS